VTAAGARSRVRVGAAVVALVVGTTAWFVATTGADGASSPEGAVEDLVAAATAGDPVGVLEAIVPAERDSLAEPLGELVDGLQAGGALAGDAGLDGPLPGVGIEVEDLRLARGEEISRRVQPVEAVGGIVRVRVAAEAVPDPEVRAALAEGAEVDLDGDDLVVERDLSRRPLVLVTLGDGGGWHVSLAYTAAEAARRDAGAPLPDLEFEGPETIGSTTPEEVVSDLFGALEARYPRRVAELVDPREGRAAYQYASLWFPGLQAAADEAGRGERWDLRVDELVTAESGEGEVRRVAIERLDLTLVDGPADEVVRLQVTEDGCTTWTTVPGAPRGGADVVVAPGPEEDAEVRRVCPGSGWTDGAGRPLEPEGVALADLVVLDGLGGPRPAVSVVDRGGRWFLAPGRTVLDSLVEGLETAPEGAEAGWATSLVRSVQRAAEGPHSAR
jgi:hypothetical protein